MLRPRLLIFLAAIGVAAAVGEASAATPGDPFERMNRWFYGGSTAADRRIFLPIARLYHRLTPGPIGEGIHNLIINIGEPVIIANDILQAKLLRATNDLARLATNSTLGLGGLIDVAKTQGLPYRQNDFGVTLGRWGVGPGPYLFLPILGPSDVRDAIGQGADVALSPLTWVRFPGRIALGVSTAVVGTLDERVRAEPQLNAIVGGAADPYATLRSVYLQSREAEIRGESAIPILPPLDEGALAAPVPALAQAPPVIEPPSAAAAVEIPPATAQAGEAAAVAADGPIVTSRSFDAAEPAIRPLAGA